MEMVALPLGKLNYLSLSLYLFTSPLEVLVILE
jgi:hypothetical protein